MAVKLDKSNLVRNLAKKTKLVVHLDKAIAADEYVWEAKFEPKLGDDAWHPSGDCIPSLHELWQKATGQGVEKDWSGMRKYGPVGHFWHQYLQFITKDVLEFCDAGAIERRGLKVWGYHDPNPPFREVRPKPFHWVTGAGDVAPADIPGHGE